jgi:hypothetical protein
MAFATDATDDGLRARRGSVNDPGGDFSMELGFFERWEFLDGARVLRVLEFLDGARSFRGLGKERCGNLQSLRGWLLDLDCEITIR